MFFLSLAVLIPWLVYVIGRWTHNRFELDQRLSKPLYWCVLVLIVLGLLPHLIEDHGMWALIWTGTSTLVFFGLESVGKSQWLKCGENSTSIVLAILIGFHALIDGFGIAAEASMRHATHQHGQYLSWTIVVHRIPACLALAHSLLQSQNLRRLKIIFGTMSLATICGYLSSKSLSLNWFTNPEFHFVEYFIIGGLIHLGVHQKPLDNQEL